MALSARGSEPTQVEVDTFTIGANPQVKDEDVGDGTYAYFFEFIAPTNASALSNMVTYTIRNGRITTSVDNSMTGAAGQQGGFAETGYGADPNLLQTGGGGYNGGSPSGGSIADQLGGGGNGGYNGGAPSGGGSIAESLGR